MRKKKRWVFLVSLLVVSLLTIHLAGCTPTEEGDPSPNGADPEKVDLVFGHSSVGGTWHAFVEGIAEIVRGELDYVHINTVPGSSGTNLIKLGEREIDVGIANNYVAADAINGNEPFEREYTELRSLTRVFTGHSNLIVRKKLVEETGYVSLKDFIDNEYPLRVGMDTLGSGPELMNSRLLAEYGVTYDDIEDWGGNVVFVSMRDAADMIGDGLLDAHFASGEAPLPMFVELHTRTPITLLEIESEVLQAMDEKYGAPAGELEAGTYPDQEEAVRAFEVTGALFTTTDMSYDLAYEITRVLVEQREARFGDIHASLGRLQEEEMPSGTGAPLHPGAEALYRDKGIID